MVCLICQKIIWTCSDSSDEAVKAYTLAIEESPTSPSYHLGRAIAQHKIKNYDAALADSERTIVLALTRGNKSVRATAQFRRGYATVW